MTNTTLTQQIIEQLNRLTPDQQQKILNYARGLGRPRGTPGKEFIERTKDIHIDPEDLRLMEQAIEEEFERIDLDEWNLPA